jgi:hypothetical protein
LTLLWLDSIWPCHVLNVCMPPNAPHGIKSPLGPVPRLPSMSVGRHQGKFRLSLQLLVGFVT